MFAKKYKFYVACLATFMIVVTGCQQQEQEPLDVLPESLIYDEMDINAFYAEQVLNNIYSYLPTGFNRIDGVFLDAATDDAIASEEANNIEIISEARQNPTSTVDQVWGKYYEAIRKVNLFLSKIDQVPTTNERKSYWKAEARFIRAMAYFELVKRYGGVPLLGDRILDINDNLNIPRNTFEQSVDYIRTELNGMKGKLRKEPLADIDLGRITLGAALALKSRLFLYSASPLHNPNNTLSRWDSAYVASKAVMDLNVYSLVTATGTNAGATAFRNVFIVRKNSEVILAFQRAQSQVIEKDNAPVGFTAPNASAGLMSPTQDLVDAFPMNTGLPINKTLATYLANPYANRDPRFDVTIFYNNSRWLRRNVETFENGLDKPNQAGRVQTRTGYYLRKFMGDFGEATAYSNQNHNFIIFRYAEILLNFAEAANELGKTTEALTQLRALRTRAGITAGTAATLYGLKTAMNQEEMREAIRLERRLELAFEEHRFWDMRRWKLAGTAFNKNLKGMSITKTGTNTFNYQEIDIAPLRFIAPKMYLYPIPFNETLRNTALIQNEGWNI